MATKLNLEEQDQLDALKHFWSQFRQVSSAPLRCCVLLASGRLERLPLLAGSPSGAGLRHVR
jgi:predicted negative regulator of RcsB-dependent stress response